MEVALGIDLIYTEPEVKYEYVFVEVSREEDMVTEETVEYESAGDERQSEYELAF
jgi:hypothetical protein